MCLTLDILGFRKTIQSNCHRYQTKRRKIKELSAEEKEYNKNQSRKRNSDRAHHLQDEKTQDNGRHLQKQVEKVQQDIRYSVRAGKLQNIASSF